MSCAILKTACEADFCTLFGRGRIEGACRYSPGCGLITNLRSRCRCHGHPLWEREGGRGNLISDPGCVGDVADARCFLRRCRSLLPVRRRPRVAVVVTTGVLLLMLCCLDRAGGCW